MENKLTASMPRHFPEEMAEAKIPKHKKWLSIMHGNINKGA
jgi:hypothetical protein